MLWVAVIHDFYNYDIMVTLLSIQSNKATSDAVLNLKDIKNPRGVCVQSLRNMFPVTKQTIRKRPFDPQRECVSLAAQKKKKASSVFVRVKPVTIQAVMLTKGAPLVLPKGKRRLTLADERRIITITIKRAASPQEVRNAIMRVFDHCQLGSFEYLEASGGILTISNNQNPGGDIVDRRGSLYLREAQVSFHMHAYIVHVI